MKNEECLPPKEIKAIFVQQPSKKFQWTTYSCHNSLINKKKIFLDPIGIQKLVYFVSLDETTRRHKSGFSKGNGEALAGDWALSTETTQL